MLTDYVLAALRKAKYQMLDGKEGFVGTIPGFRGVIGNAATLEHCRDDLRAALEGWLLVKLRHNDNDFPVIGGINLNSKPKKSKVA